MRSIPAAAAVFGLVLGFATSGAGPSDGARPATAHASLPTLTAHYRAAREYNALYCAVVEALRVHPDLGRPWRRAEKALLRGDFRLDEDLKEIRITHNTISVSFRDSVTGILPEVIATKDAFDTLGRALRPVVEREIDAVEDRLDRYAALFPDKKVTVQRRAIEAARADVAEISIDTNFEQTVIRLRKAASRLKNLRTFPYVERPPRSKCPAPLPRGSIVEGPWALYDFDDQAPYAGFFRANWGSVTPFSNGTMLDVRFGYCNGINVQSIEGRFTCPAAPGTHTVSGSVTFGPNSLCCSLAPGATVTIEAIDTVAGYVSGTFDIRASNGSGGGPGRFFLLLSEE
jgi:hypothetical protein